MGPNDQFTDQLSSCVIGWRKRKLWTCRIKIDENSGLTLFKGDTNQKLSWKRNYGKVVGVQQADPNLTWRLVN